MLRHCTALAASVLLWHAPVMAAGTAAGTDIANTATADYVIAGSSGTASGTVIFRVDEKLDVNVSWQDAANVSVSTPDTDRVTTWLLTNTGNGNDSYTLTVNNALGGDQFDPAYLKLNPKGVVPTLVDDDAVIRESTVICEYLDEAFPDPPTTPSDPAGRAEMRLWTKQVDEELHPVCTVVTFVATHRHTVLAAGQDRRRCGQQLAPQLVGVALQHQVW